MCGNEITRTDRTSYCSVECYTKATNLLNRIKATMKKIAKKYDFDIENKDKIAKAKFLLFKNDDMKRCPCDANNPDRFCGSALCIHDVIQHGHCHCNLFHYKKKPLANKEK